MSGTSSRNDPYTSFNFIVDIQGMRAGFAEVGGLSTETDVIEYREGSEDITMRKIAGKRKYTPITLKRGFTDSPDLWNWSEEARKGKTRRLPGTITMRNEAQKDVIVWKIYEAWPSKWAGPAFNAKNNEIAIEELNLVVEGLEMEIKS
jgi:phage tail-like protein